MKAKIRGLTRPGANPVLFKIIFVAGAILVLLAATIVAHNLSSGPLPVLQRDLRDALHAPGFVIITVVVFFCIRRAVNARHPYSVAFGICVALAVVAEGSQFFGSRDADFGDLAADGLGILAGLLIGGLLNGDFRSGFRHGPYRLLAITCGILLSLLVVFPLADAGYAIAAQRSVFPRLADFETRWEQRLYAGSLVRGLKIVPSPGIAFHTGERTALLNLSRASVPGLKLFPYSDWSGFEELVFTVASASASPIEIILRIHDQEHNNEHDDRYNQRFVVPVEPLTIRIALSDIAARPAKRKLDLRNIDAIIIFVSSPTGNEKIYIDNIHLD